MVHGINYAFYVPSSHPIQQELLHLRRSLEVELKLKLRITNQSKNSRKEYRTDKEWLVVML